MAPPSHTRPGAHPTADDRNLLRWGGLTALAGSAVFVAVLILVILHIGPEPDGPEGPISRFPEIRAARTVENGLYLAVMLLWAPLSVALHRGLRGARAAFARFGSVLNLMGLAVLAAGALPHVVAVHLSDRYHATDATVGERETLVLLWQATQGLFDAILLAGLLMTPIGVILIGFAMNRGPGFGRMVGGLSVGLGTVGLAAATVMLIDPLSPLAAVTVLTLIAFHLLAGWRAYRLSGRPAPTANPPEKGFRE
ncbi:hypothetical protein [Nocardiopsis lucentensis]|uniref:hypothetical protein n=1 Tax=Nocardiopsis lucentensis TaxID=53441 RepID=UPI00034DC906|nr:hypothetical protein [Nocardiopsis lucentensis]